MRLNTLLSAFRVLLVLGLIVGPAVYGAQYQKHMRNFRVVKEGVLYRSGQLTPEGLCMAIELYGIRTIVSLRDTKVPGYPPPDAEEEKYICQEGGTYVRLSPLGWEDPNGATPPVQENVDKFLEVMRNPKYYPVLVHCFAGKHRTGAYCAIYRMEIEGWSLDDALKELREGGYDNIEAHSDLLGYLKGRADLRSAAKP